MTYVKVNDVVLTAEISGNKRDIDWDGRDSKTIHAVSDYATVASLFVDDAKWSIIVSHIDKQTGEEAIEEYDNSDYCMAGDIIDHRDGTISVKMGKQTDLELAYETLYGKE